MQFNRTFMLGLGLKLTAENTSNILTEICKRFIVFYQKFKYNGTLRSEAALLSSNCIK